MGLTAELHRTGYAVQELRLVDRNSLALAGFSVICSRGTSTVGSSRCRVDLAAMIYRCIDGHVETLFGESVSAIMQHEFGARVTFERAHRLAANGAARVREIAVVIRARQKVRVGERRRA
ncbi:hypothetical protein [Mycobacterium celatum]|nr:hypothetical protein [Mycobacterium celatum]